MAKQGNIFENYAKEMKNDMATIVGQQGMMRKDLMMLWKNKEVVQKLQVNL